MEDEERRNGWNEWSRHVLAELQRLDENQQKMTAAIDNIRNEVANARGDIKVLYLKAGVVGLVGGMIPALVALALIFLK